MNAAIPPTLTLADALAALHHAPQVWCLAGPWSVLTWDVEPATLADLPLAPETNQISSTPNPHGWDRFAGGWLVQLDYEGAVDVVRVRSGLVWDPLGICRPFGDVRLPGAARPAIAPRLAEAALRPAWDCAGHVTRVRRISAHIAAGDCYQVNLTLPFCATLKAGDDLDVFAALLAANPAPFAGCIRRPGRPSIVSHSPECLVACADGVIASSPIKGTRPLGHRAELLTSAKDAAELAMIVDLVRNDLGRVAEPGSVRVMDAGRVIDLPYAHHRAADIVARLRPGTGWRDILGAVFPAGSITGAPKRKAMEIISSIEGGPRGPYCGSFGWVDERGAGQLNVAIRTAIITTLTTALTTSLTTSEGDRQQIAVHAGGGIVADSIGEHEWAEVLTKASAFAAVLKGT